MASIADAKLIVKNTFLSFNIQGSDFDIRCSPRPRAASAEPPTSTFSIENNVKKVENNALNKDKNKNNHKTETKDDDDDDRLLKSAIALVRSESWPVFAIRKMEQHDRIKEKWAQFTTNLLRSEVATPKRRFSITKRFFFNLSPWLDLASVLRFKTTEIIRPIDAYNMEVWASDKDLRAGKLSSLYPLLVHFQYLFDRTEVMVFLVHSDASFIFKYTKEQQIKDVRAKAEAENMTPMRYQKMLCQGRELKCGCLGDYDVRPGDVISVIFR